MENKKGPKPGMEYIYATDYAFPLDENGEYDRSIPVESGMIVNRLTRTDRGGYNFMSKETEQRFYMDDNPYLFWENTPENLEKIKLYKDSKRSISRLQLRVEALFADIDTLK